MSIGSMLMTFRDIPSVSSSWVQQSWTAGHFKISCPESSVANYGSTLRKILEDYRSILIIQYNDQQMHLMRYNKIHIIKNS